jgi:hypothetical protein
MKFEEFINKYFGKKVDFDGVYGAQCVDLFRQYCKDVLNIPHTGGVEGAKDLYLNYNKMEGEKLYFNRINKGSFQFGDVVIWNATETNKYGHVALFVSEISADSILVFEQNGFTQDGAKFAVRNKTNLLGVLRKK